MLFRKAPNAPSSLQDIMRLCMLSSLGGFANRLEIANRIIVEPSVRSNPYLDSNSDNFSLETLWSNPKDSSVILSPIVFILSRLYVTS
jgi:hypothetical protein